MPRPIRRTVVTVAVAALMLMVGGAVTAQTVQRFPDVPSDHPEVDAIEWAAEVGITAGYTDGTFRPEQPLSKSHALVFMDRYYDQILQADESPGFTRGDMMALLKAINDADASTGTPTQPVPNHGSVDTDACRALRRTSSYTYPGNPVERFDVNVVSVGFDPPGFFDDLPVPEFRRDEVLAAVETQIEQLSHGRTDVVFYQHDDIILNANPDDYTIGPDFLGNRIRLGLIAEVRKTHPDMANMMIFTATTVEHATTSFQTGSSAVVGVEGPRPDNPLDPDIRFYWARSAATHELLHMLGLDDLYATTERDPSSAGGEWSMMGLRAYGWGRGSTSGLHHQRMHEPVTGWNKWLLGWLDGPEVACITPTEPTTVVLRPHQHVESVPYQPYRDLYPAGSPGANCWRSGGPIWGTAAAAPVIAIIPTSATTALVVEADPFTAKGRSDTPRCGPRELPTERTTREIGDVIVYAVDTTLPTGNRPQRMLNPTTAMVTPAEHAQITTSHSPLGHVGQWFTPSGGWPQTGIPVNDYYTTELTAHGYRISVVDRNVGTDGQPEITVMIERLE